MLSRFRSAWLSKNLELLVLRLLRESSLSEWEILASLHARYALSPNARDFGRLEKELLAHGYASLVASSQGSKLQITAAGLGVLLMLEAEYRTVVSTVVQGQPSGPQLR
jgi:hypothetical protein